MKPLKKSAIAAGLLKQDTNSARFWAAYMNAQRKDTVSPKMTEYADWLLQKQQTGLKLFNQL